MSWSIAERSRIVEQFWQSGVARCPTDNGPLRIKLRKLLGGDYDLFAECLVCGKNKNFRRADDPCRAQFRAWTPPESDRLLKMVARFGQAGCPVCGAAVERFDPAVTIPAPALIRCLRCGNSNQWQPFFNPRSAIGRGRIRRSP